MLKLMAAAGVAVLAFAGSASAVPGLIISGSIGGAPTGATLENLDTLVPGSLGGATPSGITVAASPDGMVVSGSVGGIYAAPFLSGGNGFGFGPAGTNQADGVDTTPYLTTGSSGALAGANVTLTFPGTERYLGLLWGSVDAYNTLLLFNGATLEATITGSDVLASPDGDQGVNGTVYVNIDADAAHAFTSAVFTSSAFAFEFDNVAFNPSTLVPEPATLALLGAGLLGLGLVRRTKKQG